ncbi:Alpha/Beta hydrolase protein [Lasiosphaeris hirsuta]|uniref:Alpha/Beta hydrolase protein n=1 Tax=Lasiosphaeris hirsuta TaxID=260670 RepID=A0AA40AZ39_9PEZI|nr:Alpha/Beta hydrolase protein [Lasiosphaeris hirsuta]
MSNLRLDPGLAAALAPFANMLKPEQANTAHELRATNDATIGIFFGGRVPPSTVTVTNFTFPAKDSTPLKLYRYAPTAADPAKPGPAVLDIHGGGMVSGSPGLFASTLWPYVERANVTIYAVQYRLAPEFPFPTPVDDAYAALEWLQANAAEQNIDPKRIAVSGASAGGGIAAGLALKARDEKLSPPIAKLILVYPMLDDRTQMEPDHPMAPYLTWTSKNNVIGWTAYVGEDRSNVSPYAAPARATDLSGLPRTFIDTGGLDLFRDEDIQFAARLAKANVDVEFHLYPGVSHGFDALGESIPVAKKAIANRADAFKEF